MKNVRFSTRTPGQSLQITIPAPIITGSISCPFVNSQIFDVDFRVDTGADISALPISFMELLDVEPRHAVSELPGVSGAVGWGGRIPVYRVDLLFSQSGLVDLYDVHVVFLDPPLDMPLLGIWTALEHSGPLTCDFQRHYTRL